MSFSEKLKEIDVNHKSIIDEAKQKLVHDSFVKVGLDLVAMSITQKELMIQKKLIGVRWWSSIPPPQLNRELGTLRLCAPRAIGHSTLVRALVKEYSSLLIFPNYKIRDQAMQYYHYNNLVSPRNIVYQNKGYHFTPERLWDCELIIIDTAMAYKQNELEELQSFIYHRCNCKLLLIIS